MQLPPQHELRGYSWYYCSNGLTADGSNTKAWIKEATFKLSGCTRGGAMSRACQRGLDYNIEYPPWRGVWGELRHRLQGNYFTNHLHDPVPHVTCHTWRLIIIGMVQNKIAYPLTNKYGALRPGGFITSTSSC